MEKKLLYNTSQEAFQFLMKSGHYFSASIIGWNYILKSVSSTCFNNSVLFHSTETALAGFFSISNDKGLNIQIHQAYLMTTILNFDNDNEFSKNELTELCTSISIIINNLISHGKTE